MSDRNRTRRLASLLAVGTLAVGLTACGGDDGGGSGGGGAPSPGVTDTEVTFGSHQPLTGPAAAGYAVISPATKAYFDYVNAKGGIHGRKLVYKAKDDGYNPANTQKVVRELVLQDKVFAVLNGLGTPTHTGVLDFLKSNRVPDLFVASGSRSWNQPQKYPTTFGYHPDYTVESKIAANHIKTEMAGKKVCALGQDDDFGADALRGLEAVLDKDGLAERQRYVTTNTNLAPQIGKLKAAGCEVVHLATIPGFTALALGTAARIGFQPQWFSTSVGADYRAVAETLGKKGEPLLEGFLATNYLPIVDDTSNPWVRFFKDEVQAKYNAGKPFDGQTLYGMAIGYATAELLQKNGKELTRESIVETLEKGGLKGAGLVPMNFSKDNHSGYSGARVNVVKDGKQAYFGPTFTTDDGTGPVEEYTGEENTPPTDGMPTR